MANRAFGSHLRAGLSLALVSSVAAASTNSGCFTRVWQTDDGLPNNQVTAIVQGPDGFLWIGTALGLARFDGISFTRVYCSNSSSNEDQGVSALLAARAGGLYVLTRQGSLVRLGADFAPAAMAGKDLPHERALAMIEDRERCLWIAYIDSIWQVKNGEPKRLTGLQDMRVQGYPSGFAIDSDGNMWFARATAFIFYAVLRFHLAWQVR